MSCRSIGRSRERWLLSALLAVGVAGLRAFDLPAEARAAKSIFDDDWKPPPSSQKEGPAPKPPPIAEAPPEPPPVPAEPSRIAPRTTPKPSTPKPGPKPKQPKPATPAPVVPLAKPPPVKLPVPNATAIANSDKLIKDLYKAEYAKRAPGDQLNLARMLWGEATRLEDDPASRYVLLREARDLAAGGGDVGLAMEIVRAIRTEYEGDTKEMSRTALASAVRGLLATPNNPAMPPTARRASDLAMWAAERELDGGEYLAAAQAAALAISAAQKSLSKDLLFGAKARATEIQVIANEFNVIKPASERLKSSPDDPIANTSFGRFLAFVRGRPELGLPLLARGADVPLRNAAAKDMEAPDAPDQQVVAGDGWAAAAKSQSPLARDAMNRRALFWYFKAVTRLEGLSQAAVQKKINDLRLAGLQGGLLGEYFRGREFQCKVFNKIDKMLDANWGGRNPDDAMPSQWFSVRWSGWLKAPAAGKYKLIVVHDDGVRLWLDGKPVVDHWMDGIGKESAEVDLNGEFQELKIEYFQAKGGSYFGLGWQPPNAPKAKAVPAEALFHEPVPPGPGIAMPPTPDRNGKITLPAVQATIHGRNLTYAHAIGKSEHLGSWNNAADWVSWDFVAPAGQYQVDVTYACDGRESGGQFTVAIGANQLPGSVTGNGWDRYHTDTLGTVYLSSGDQLLSLRPTSKPHKSLMDLQAVVLTPVK